MRVVLASASPRRQQLLEQLSITPLIHPADFTECGGNAGEARDVVLANAVGKCSAVAAELGDELAVIAADTVVVIDNDILGKPQDTAMAEAMLQHLSGRRHQVMTGVAVRYRGKQLADVCVTDVSFRKLSDEEIKSYAASGEPLDKAGAYGIQGRGAVLVEKIDGCYNNVVGLPLTMLYLMLKKIGAQGVMNSD